MEGPQVLTSLGPFHLRRWLSVIMVTDFAARAWRVSGFVELIGELDGPLLGVGLHGARHVYSLDQNRAAGYFGRVKGTSSTGSFLAPGRS